MSTGSQRGATAMVEGLIAQVRGVLAVRVLRNEQDQIEEIHIIGSPQRSAKQMVRDVESILYVRGGVRVDHRKISLVQLADAPNAAAIAQVRLIDAAYCAQERVATVTLALGDQRLQGVCGADAAEGAPERLVGAATIDALDQLLGLQSRLRLEHAQRQILGQIEICLAHLSLDDGEALLGISVVGDDGMAAMAQSVLDAVSRRSQRNAGALPALAF